MIINKKKAINCYYLILDAYQLVLGSINITDIINNNSEFAANVK